MQLFFVFLIREREEDVLFEAMIKNKGEKITFYVKKSPLKIAFFILLHLFLFMSSPWIL